MYFVYVLKNQQGLLYKGQTNDILKRVKEHNSNDGFASYTKSRGPWTLVYFEEFLERSDAKNREKFLKTGKGRSFLRGQIAEKAVSSC